jgi:osmotically-inducible protein OsmY
VKQYSRRNPQLATWLGGIAAGAMAMYLADPVGGKRRRLLVQEKMRMASARTGGALSQVMHGTGNRLSAAQYRAKDLMRRPALDDESLHARVRNAVSRLTSIPSDIRIKVEQGCVALSGMIEAKEKDRLLRKLGQMPGVHELRDHLAMRHDNRTRSFLSERRQDTQHVGV